MIGEVAFYKINRTHLVIAWIQVDPTCNLWISALQQMSCHFEKNFSRLPTKLIELWAAFSIHIKILSLSMWVFWCKGVMKIFLNYSISASKKNNLYFCVTILKLSMKSSRFCKSRCYFSTMDDTAVFLGQSLCLWAR